MIVILTGVRWYLIVVLISISLMSIYSCAFRSYVNVFFGGKFFYWVFCPFLIRLFIYFYFELNMLYIFSFQTLFYSMLSFFRCNLFGLLIITHEYSFILIDYRLCCLWGQGFITPPCWVDIISSQILLHWSNGPFSVRGFEVMGNWSETYWNFKRQSDCLREVYFFLFLTLGNKWRLRNKCPHFNLKAI